MFNMYQELVDRIEELLKEREVLKRKIKRIENIYAKIPPFILNDLYKLKYITKEEKIYWSILQSKKIKEKKDNEYGSTKESK